MKKNTSTLNLFRLWLLFFRVLFNGLKSVVTNYTRGYATGQPYYSASFFTSEPLIFHTIYDDCFAAGFVDQVTNYTLHFTSPGFIKHSLSVFHSKDCLQVDLVISVCHVILFYMSRAYSSCFYFAGFFSTD